MSNMLDLITDHVERAQDNLIPRWREGVNARALVEAFVEEIQELENVTLEVMLDRALDVAEGAQLDQYGELLDEQRAGRNDTDYRRLLRIKIIANREAGVPDTVTFIASVLFDSETVGVRYIHNQPASYQLQVTPDTPLTAQEIADGIRFVEFVTPAGVGITEIVTSTDEPFAFAGGDGFGFGVGELSERIL
jgi:hypothetical protein